MNYRVKYKTAGLPDFFVVNTTPEKVTNIALEHSKQHRTDILILEIEVVVPDMFEDAVMDEPTIRSCMLPQ